MCSRRGGQPKTDSSTMERPQAALALSQGPGKPAGPQAALAVSQGPGKPAASTWGHSKPAGDPLWAEYHHSDRVNLLGRGSFGMVLLARRRADQASHALKFCDVIKNPEWMLEYQMLKQHVPPGHPNVVEVLGCYQPRGWREEGVLVFPVADLDLHAWLQRRADRLSENMSLQIGRQVCAGLAHVHGHGVLHRDVKPSNILLHFVEAPAGMVFPRAVLADFGMARQHAAGEGGPCLVAGPLEDPDQRLMTRLVVTAWYRAPELLLAKKELLARYSYAVDVWSWGCVVYEMVEGQPLVASASESGMLACICAAIGPCPEHLTGAQEANAEIARSSIRPREQILSSGGDEARSCVSKALLWDPASRSSMRCLLAEFGKKEGEEGAGDIRGAPGKPEFHEGPSPCRVAGPQVGPPTPALASSDTTSTTASMLWQWSATPSASKDADLTLTGSETCKCSGHCYTPGHRYHQGCSCQSVRAESRLCVDCECSVPNCSRPRLRGPLCSMHRRLVEQGPEVLGVVRAAQPNIQNLMPCDVEDFLQHYPGLAKDDHALMFFVALFKEPTATRAFLEAVPPERPLTAMNIMSAISKMLDALDGAPHESELKQLNRQGVGRFVGAASTCRTFGLIRVLEQSQSQRSRKKARVEPQGQKQAGVWSLGLGERRYEPTGNLEEIQKVLEFTRTHSFQPGHITSHGEFEQCVQAAADFDEGLAKQSPVWRKMMGYVRAFLRRKLVLGALRNTPHTDRNVDWGLVPLSLLQAMCPDQHDALGRFPSSWSARDVSNFVLGREDWGVLVSMYCCLFNEPLETLKKQGVPADQLASLVGSEVFTTASVAHIRDHGMVGHPSMVVARCGEPATWRV